MYYVVEFLEEGTIAVVPNTWMTNLESCRWPPSTAEWKNRLTSLIKKKSTPEDCFGTYNIRVLGTSEILKIANEKAKNLERGRATSEINTTDCETKTNGRPKRKSTKRKTYSSSSESEHDLSSEELTLSIPPLPPPPLLQFSPSLNAAAIVTDLNKDGASLTPQSSSLTLHTYDMPTTSQQFSPSLLQQRSVTGQNVNRPVTSLTPQSKKTKFQADGAGYFGCESFSTNVGRPVALEDVNTSGMEVKTLLRLNAEFHKHILRKLKLIEAEQTRQRDFLIQQSNGAYKQHRLQSLPFSLPISTKGELFAVEEFLKVEDNQDIMIRHLKLVGGAELEIAIRGILSRCMTNGMASNFSYFGLRNKENFKSLKLKKVVFNAVQLLFPEVSEAKFSKITGDWFRYAPRKKGGNKQREEKDPIRKKKLEKEKKQTQLDSRKTISNEINEIKIEVESSEDEEECSQKYMKEVVAKKNNCNEDSDQHISVLETPEIKFEVEEHDIKQELLLQDLIDAARNFNSDVNVYNRSLTLCTAGKPYECPTQSK